MPEGSCCCLQTCIVVILMLVIEYIMSTKFRSHSSYIPFVSYTDTCDPIIMGLFVCCLQRNKYDQSLRVKDIGYLKLITLCYLV